MRYGICVNMVSNTPEKTGAEYIREAAALGYDYIELPIAEMTAVSEERFEEILGILEENYIRCETCNNFFPASIRLTGEDADYEVSTAFARKAFARMKRLGAEYVSFGSGAAKWVPDGFPKEKAYRQIVDQLKLFGPIARENGVTVVIEPLRQAECNIINTFEEGVKLARDVDDENIKVLVDYYHLAIENEPAEHIERYGQGIMKHVHLSNPDRRTFCRDIEESDYLPFIEALHNIGYDERVSMEAYSDNFSEDAAAGIRFMRKYF